MKLTSASTMIIGFSLVWQTGCGDGDASPLKKSNEKNNSTDSTEGDSDKEFKDASVTTTDCPDIGFGEGLFSNRYDKGTIRVDESDKTYMLHTNWWYLFDGQAVEYDGLSFVVKNPNDAAVSPTEGAPTGYPSLYIGSYSGSVSQNSNLPIPVTEIESVPTSFHTNALEIGLADKNAAYDVWLTESGDPLPSTQYTPGRGGAYLMVWLFMPDDRQPRGANAHPEHTVEGVDGSWDVWIDRTDPPCISYVSTDPLDGLDFDLNAFIRDSVVNEYGITDDMHLSIIFAGFEIWGGGDGLAVERFCAQVNPAG